MLKSQQIFRLKMISSRNDVLSFCYNALEQKSQLRLETDSLECLFSESCFFIIDGAEFQNMSFRLFEQAKVRSKNILILITSDIPVSIRNYCEGFFHNVIFFPIDSDLFMLQVVKQVAESSKRGSLGDSKIEEPISDSLMGFFAGKSKLMRNVRAKIERASKLDGPVLLLGETGTGKSTAAELIHKLSVRREKPFASKNVSTISDTLACSTLFGTECGAYTDAVKKEGLFKTADGGTLFLDEVGMASLSLQAMLLTALESGVIQKVGSEKSERVDVRVIFATNASLVDMINTGLFRTDLYFRISDIVIQIPPLRERREDLRYMASEYAQKNGKMLSEDAFNMIEEYYWPGNIRELNQCLGRAFRNCPKELVSSDYLDFGLFN
ncbi:MAG: sigma-54-dependent Fis family transcriptional regulator [Treponema sp.]|nr:sigma-54-dependent Fis family transcriptional regulator [Treponema sp.]